MYYALKTCSFCPDTEMWGPFEEKDDAFDSILDDSFYDSRETGNLTTADSTKMEIMYKKHAVRFSEEFPEDSQITTWRIEEFNTEFVAILAWHDGDMIGRGKNYVEAVSSLYEMYVNKTASDTTQQDFLDDCQFDVYELTPEYAIKRETHRNGY